MKANVVRLATRGSPQAMTQAGALAERLRAGGQPAELVVIETHGDRTQVANVPLHSIGGVGVFVKELQLAVLDGRADAAVHSAKDLPAAPTPGLLLAAFAPRRSPADALVGRALDELAVGAPVATGSVRRRAQIAAVRPDLEFRELRGNIHTRLERVPPQGAIVMAVAALEVLGLTERIAQTLDPTQFVPAIGQGCVVVECRDDDHDTIAAVTVVDDPATRVAVTVERAYLAELGAGCTLPVGAFARDGVLHTYLAGVTGPPTAMRYELSGDLERDVAIGAAAGRRALELVGGV